MKILKTAGIAVFTAVVTAAAVVFYIDYRIDRAVEAITAPIETTTEKVDQAVAAVDETVAANVESASSALESTLTDTRDDVVTEWENGKRVVDDLSTKAADMWSGLIEGTTTG